jgi:hydrogenase maturation protein HypF
MLSSNEFMKRAEIEITGIVQGVGFRPFIFNLAKTHSVRGWVLNNEKGVLIDAESDDGNLDIFIHDITGLAPPLSHIESLTVKHSTPLGYSTFQIKASQESQEKFALISPDVATCDQCLAELFSAENFRYRYPFINCTLCGPRFTIIKDIPYDRCKTTMAPFTMCSVCHDEYENPADRRFHAQPNACVSCGPSLRLVDRKGEVIPGDPIVTTLSLLREGQIVAVKGLGGFHLSCDAENENAVSALRSRKYREDKPFAVMCRDLEEVRRHCELDKREQDLLLSNERPIVILRRKKESTLASAVAPFQNTVGVMLPYSPLHHLLLDAPLKILVMTSGNRSDEPIAYKNEEALSRLSTIADCFLLHDREIHIRCDDSVARIYDGEPYIIRRSRGYVPFPVKLPFPVQDILACGGELKNTFCLTRDSYAFMSHHIGDLENLETLDSFEKGVEHFKRLFSIEPKLIAHDLHPDYLSTKYALSFSDISKVGVQHHHAHIVSAMAENGVEGEVIGVAFDGTGFGQDGTIWGGEFLKADLRDFRRVAHLKEVPMPGSSRAIREPWRMAMAHLLEALGDGALALNIDFMKRVDLQKWGILRRMIERKVNTPLTSSMGRLFDAVASLCSLRDEVHYEGQAAIELEMIAGHDLEPSYPFLMDETLDPLVIDPAPIIRGVVDDLANGVPASRISTRFHRTVADLVVQTCDRIRAHEKINRVVLSGGVFQNIFLLSLAFDGLSHSGFEVIVHHRVPANDGGISLGQAVIAHMRYASCV